MFANITYDIKICSKYRRKIPSKPISMRTNTSSRKCKSANGFLESKTPSSPAHRLLQLTVFSSSPSSPAHRLLQLTVFSSSPSSPAHRLLQLSSDRCNKSTVISDKSCNRLARVLFLFYFPSRLEIITSVRVTNILSLRLQNTLLLF